MAVQQNKKSPAKRGMHRAHDFMKKPALAVEPLALVEDELVLALPFAPRHPEDACTMKHDPS
jgi:uncharacterized metal-binding protein YceD (DUF177 family)